MPPSGTGYSRGVQSEKAQATCSEGQKLRLWRFKAAEALAKRKSKRGEKYAMGNWGGDGLHSGRVTDLDLGEV